MLAFSGNAPAVALGGTRVTRRVSPPQAGRSRKAACIDLLCSAVHRPYPVECIFPVRPFPTKRGRCGREIRFCVGVFGNSITRTRVPRRRSGLLSMVRGGDTRTMGADARGHRTRGVPPRKSTHPGVAVGVPYGFTHYGRRGRVFTHARKSTCRAPVAMHCCMRGVSISRRALPPSRHLQHT